MSNLSVNHGFKDKVFPPLKRSFPPEKKENNYNKEKEERERAKLRERGSGNGVAIYAFLTDNSPSPFYRSQALAGPSCMKSTKGGLKMMTPSRYIDRVNRDVRGLSLK
ncbi:hypothetical protein CEXT_303061 [Caerostris extrusa]|uniref:Uncharacterized protein n=1 Tax=Caerostris extrusa TaxID=172846 RepID=A0AAV4MUM6_CAEEX|nr:hypothetical protein CEXT_303061 [Caerostris extrusa]